MLLHPPSPQVQRARPMAQGQVAHWPLSEGSGLNANELLSANHVGTLDSATWKQTIQGNVVDFDGTNDIIDVPASAALTDIWTNGGSITFWCYPRTLATTNPRFIDKTSNSSFANGWSIYSGGVLTRLNFARKFSTTAGKWRVNTVLTVNAWNFVCITYNDGAVGNDPTFYINAVDKGTPAPTTTPVGTPDTDAAQTLAFGARLNSSGQHDTLMSDIRWWDRVLNANEVSLLFSGLDATLRPTRLPWLGAGGGGGGNQGAAMHHLLRNIG